MASDYSGLETFSLSVSASNAILQYPEFARLNGISKASQGKSFNVWTEADKKLWWNKLQKTVGAEFFVSITYLPSDDYFFVRAQSGNSGMVEFRDKAPLQYALIGGDEYEGERAHYILYLRSIKGTGWCLTPTLKWDNGEFGDKQRSDFQVLCNFPLVATQGSDKYDEAMKRHGFKVTRHLNVDGYTDDFGDYEYFDARPNFEKSGVQFHL